jgi:hydrogenase maturation factor HypF (carbamoyltransferase family)
VLAGVRSGLEATGLLPLTHRDLPVNDGDVSFGQAVVAWARRDTV